MNEQRDYLMHEFSPGGSLFIMDFWGCDFELLNSPEFLLKHTTAAAKMAGMQVLAHLIIPFSPQGLSLALILSESHLTMHSTPEFGYVGIDIFTCGKGNPELASEYLIDVLKPKQVTTESLPRGRSHGPIFQWPINKQGVETYAER